MTTHDGSTAIPDDFPGVFATDVWPDILRSDAGIVLMSEWDAGGPERQLAVLDGAAAAWRGTPLPAGFLSGVFLAGDDGRSIFNYAQWTSQEAHREFARTEASGLGGRMAAVLDGLENAGPRPYRYYGSLLPRSGDGGRADESGGEGRRVPGCVVRVAFDTAGEEAARRLVDGLLDLMGGVQPNPEGGGIASHFHLSQDGTRVVNYSEWTDAEAHRRTVETALQPGGPVAELIASIPGVTPRGFARFRSATGVVRR